MDFLDGLETNRQLKSNVQQLQQRKQQLQKRLAALCQKKKHLEDEFRNDIQAENQETNETEELEERLRCYRLLGISLESIEKNLVLRFDPLAAGLVYSERTCLVELRETDDIYELVKHNLLPFLPVQDLVVKHLYKKDVPSFSKQVSNFLYCYNIRCQQINAVKEAFKDRLLQEPDVDLPVSYIQLQIQLDDQCPVLTITLTYGDLEHTLPSLVELVQGACPEGRQPVTKQTLQSWRQALITKPLVTGLQQILQTPQIL